MSEKIIKFDFDKDNIYLIQYVPDEPIIHIIGGRYFEVTTHFDDKGTESVLHQFIELLK